MVSIIFGANDYARKQALDSLVQSFTGNNPGALPQTINGPETDAAHLVQSVQSTGLFATEQCIVLKNASKNKYLADDMAKVLDAVGPETMLIIVEENLDKRTSFYKLLMKQGNTTECTALDHPAAINWVVEFVGKKNGNITRSSAQFLVERVGPDQWMLSSELQKLLIANSVITNEHILELVDAHPQETIFALTDAVSYGNNDRAQQLYTDLLRQKLEPFYIMSMLSWQLHNMVVLSADPNNPSYIKKIGINPYVARKTADVVRRLSKASLKKMVGVLIEADLLLKTTSADAEVVLGQALHKLCREVQTN